MSTRIVKPDAAMVYAVLALRLREPNLKSHERRAITRRAGQLRATLTEFELSRVRQLIGDPDAVA